jgi:Tol biopolymer transport system component
MFPIRSQGKILFSLLCLLGLSVLIGCAPKPNRFGIIFTTNDTVGPTDIYRIPDNTQNKIERLTSTPTIGEYGLLVSKNGEKVIFAPGPTGLTEEPSELAIENFRHIYLLDTASKELVDITNILVEYSMVGSGFSMDWSPDQKQFAVAEGDLELMNFDGTNKRVISIPSLGEYLNIKGAKWSPDGKKLALIRGNVPETPQHHGIALLIYDLGSGKISQLTDYQEGCGGATWSPTSQQVAATCSAILPYTDMVGPETVRIFSTENPGRPYERLAMGTCRDPSWSPDGKQLAFVCEKSADQGGQFGLFVINSDGNGIHEVKLGNLGSPTYLRYPTWSPDGTQIIYEAATNDGHSRIYSVNSDGSNNHALTNQDAVYNIVSVYPMP